MDLEIVLCEPIRVVALRHTGPYHEIGPKFQEIFGWASKNNVQILGSVGVYHDDPKVTPAEELTSDACLIISDDFILPENQLGLAIQIVQGGTYAKTTHLGSYDGLYATWKVFIDELLTNYEDKMVGPSYELYVNDCTEVPEEELRTELYERIKSE